MPTRPVAERKDSPYKFLDAYDRDDREIFFGRERETQTLLSDIVISRLVVLFAKTGTGKTSLINAGVRPLLEEDGYHTVFVRVRGDALGSLRDALADEKFDFDVTKSLGAQLTLFAEQVEKPTVVFFDQFEEFFQYTAFPDPPRGAAFVDEVASAYRENRDVHIVFSMREDFFAQMDMFRDELPTIFHNDSNLRLQWFDLDQARAAISEPAAKRQVRIERDLEDRILADLDAAGRVEPAQLQIVCDTLWEQQRDGLLTVAEYDRLATGATGTVAQQILNGRLEERLQALGDGELGLLARVLPELPCEERADEADLGREAACRGAGR